MSYLDTFHRAFKDYRRLTVKDSVCSRERSDMAKSNTQLDKFVTTKYYCEIKKDWIKAIEENLEFVEKAILEERQFIRSEGEIVPIEKVKKVSRSSVEHLAKHSNMITRLPEEEGQPIVPDELYMVEKLNDYAVYENRFLYLLLSYLRDFIALRLEKIQEIRTTYICDYAITKEINNKYRQVKYVTSFYEKRKNNPYPLEHKESDELMVRIQNVFQYVLSLLNTNLMTEVAKSPMIHPPIVKTNVLKMNNNFKHALAFYDYIVGYSEDGYVSHEVVSDFAPFEEQVADEMGEVVALTSFLTYKYGNRLEETLNTAYSAEEEKRAEEEKQKLIDQIARLKKRVAETGNGIEEYALLLEKRNRLLEQDSADLLVIKNEILDLTQKIDALNVEKTAFKDEIKTLEKSVEEKLLEIERLNQKYVDDIAALKAEHQAEVEKINKEHEEQIVVLKEEFQRNINELNLQHSEEIDKITESHRLEIEEFNERLEKAEEDYLTKLDGERQKNQENIQTIIESHNAEKTNLQTEINNLNTKYTATVSDYNERISALEGEIEKLNESKVAFVREYEKKIKEHEVECKKAIDDIKHDKDSATYQWGLMKAELRAQQIKSGEVSKNDDYTSKEKFEELEEEYKAFQTFFNHQWKMAKKNIRKSLLGNPVKDQK